MKSKFNVKQLTLLGMMIAILLLMSFTPLGYLNVGPLAITFNVIPVAIAALALGPAGGLIAGFVFGLTSFLQCLGIGGLSLMGSTLFGINPFLSIILCFVPRMLDGLLLGFIFRGVSRLNRVAACFVTGFCAAFPELAARVRTTLRSVFPSATGSSSIERRHGDCAIRTRFLFVWFKLRLTVSAANTPLLHECGKSTFTTALGSALSHLRQ